MTAHFPSLDGMPLADALRLIRTPNVGPITFFNLIQRFGSATAALERLPELSLRGGGKTPIRPFDRAEALREIERAEHFGARMALYGSPLYPHLLHAIPDPPPVITFCGMPQLWTSRRSIAIVGARNASANGCQFAQTLAREVAQAGFTIVSGLARGIDAFAHKGALAGGTVGVIAGGVDNIYPPENEGLFKQMRSQGAIISEQPFGALPFSGAFPGRNRIISGMSLATLVVEASPKSGSLITARFALEQGREVLAVPGFPLDPRARGCNGLIKQGATLIESARDVLEGIAQLAQPSFMENKSIAFAQPDAREPTESDMCNARATTLEKLGSSPVEIDTLMAQCQLSPGLLLTVLLELELAGRLQRMAGNQVCLLGQQQEPLIKHDKEHLY